VRRHATFLLWQFFNITQFTSQSKPASPKYSSENKHAPKPALPNPTVEGEVTLFGLNHEQRTA
jgi:hypothetical protein